MILETLSLIFQVHTILYILLGVASGICIGCLPGLTATMGVALVLPLTFGMDAAAGILLLVGVYVGAIYGGSISRFGCHRFGRLRDGSKRRGGQGIGNFNRFLFFRRYNQLCVFIADFSSAC